MHPHTHTHNLSYTYTHTLSHVYTHTHKHTHAGSAEGEAEAQGAGASECAMCSVAIAQLCWGNNHQMSVVVIEYEDLVSGIHSIILVLRLSVCQTLSHGVIIWYGGAVRSVVTAILCCSKVVCCGKHLLMSACYAFSPYQITYTTDFSELWHVRISQWPPHNFVAAAIFKSQLYSDLLWESNDLVCSYSNLIWWFDMGLQ